MEEIRGEGGEKMGKGTERKRVMLCIVMYGNVVRDTPGFRMDLEERLRHRQARQGKASEQGQGRWPRRQRPSGRPPIAGRPGSRSGGVECGFDVVFFLWAFCFAGSFAGLVWLGSVLYRYAGIRQVTYHFFLFHSPSFFFPPIHLFPEP